MDITSTREPVSSPPTTLLFAVTGFTATVGAFVLAMAGQAMAATAVPIPGAPELSSVGLVAGALAGGGIGTGIGGLAASAMFGLRSAMYVPGNA